MSANSLHSPSPLSCLPVLFSSSIPPHELAIVILDYASLSTVGNTVSTLLLHGFCHSQCSYKGFHLLTSYWSCEACLTCHFFQEAFPDSSLQKHHSDSLTFQMWCLCLCGHLPNPGQNEVPVYPQWANVPLLMRPTGSLFTWCQPLVCQLIYCTTCFSR